MVGNYPQFGGHLKKVIYVRLVQTFFYTNSQYRQNFNTELYLNNLKLHTSIDFWT
jgi:hypothetical protein